MPLPVLIGLPWLMGVVVTFVCSIFGRLLTFIGRRAAIHAAYVTGIISMAVIFIAVIQGLIAGLSLVIPAQVYQVVTWVLPINTSACVGIIIGAHTAKFCFTFYSKALRAACGGR